MTSLRIKKINGVPPKAAKIEGTDQKYGLDRNWRGVSRSPVLGTDEFTFTLDDGILETVEGNSRNYYSVRSDRIAKLNVIVESERGYDETEVLLGQRPGAEAAAGGEIPFHWI